MVLQYHVIEAVSSMYCVLHPRVLQSERAAIYSSCHCLDHSSFVLVWLAAPHGAVGKLTRSKLENGHCYLVINAKNFPKLFASLSFSKGMCFPFQPPAMSPNKQLKTPPISAGIKRKAYSKLPGPGPSTPRWAVYAGSFPDTPALNACPAPKEQ